MQKLKNQRKTSPNGRNFALTGNRGRRIEWRCQKFTPEVHTGPDGIPAHLFEVTADETAVGLQLISQAAILLIIRKPEAYTR